MKIIDPKRVWRVSVPTNYGPADILGMTDFHSANLYVWDFQTTPAVAARLDELSEPNPRDSIEMTDPCAARQEGVQNLSCKDNDTST